MDLIPTLIKGEEFIDNRGTLTFVNDFLLIGVKRMYLIEHPNTNIIRAWQAHKKEQKWFYVLEGAFKVILVKLDNWVCPSKDLGNVQFILSKKDNTVLHIPGGYANGLKALEENSKLLVFSDFDLKEAADDNFKFEKDYWHW